MFKAFYQQCDGHSGLPPAVLTSESVPHVSSLPKKLVDLVEVGRILESVSGARVTKTKQFGTFMTNCSPIVEGLESSSTNPGTSPIVFATTVLRGLRRTRKKSVEP